MDEIFRESRKGKGKEGEGDRQGAEVQRVETRLLEITKYRNSLSNWALSTLAMLRTLPRQDIRNKYDYLGDLLGDCLRQLLKTAEAEDWPAEVSLAEQGLQRQVGKTGVEAGELLRRNLRIRTMGN